MVGKPRMTINEVLGDMRNRGFSISQKAFGAGVDAGSFPFAKVISISEAGRKNYLIMRRDYEKWAEEYLN